MTTLSPTENYEILADCMRRAQEAALAISHLRGMDGDKESAQQWLLVSENMKVMQTTFRMMFVGAKR